MSQQLELLLFVTGVLLASQVSQHGMAGWVGGQKLAQTCLSACMAAVQTGIGWKPNEGRWLDQLTGAVTEGTGESSPSSLDECLFAGLLVWVANQSTTATFCTAS